MKERRSGRQFMVQSKLLNKFNGLEHYFFDRTDDHGKISRKIVCCEQVHGNKVSIISKKDSLIKSIDGMITNKPLFLAIRTADCLPVFFFDKKKNLAAAVHAGWKGILSGVLENTLLQFKKLAASPKDLMVVIGPHIRACCYDVGLEREKMFADRFGKDGNMTVNRLGKIYLSLEKAAQKVLTDCGILPGNLDIIPICTCCDRRFYSFRREGKGSGRNLSVIRSL